LGQLGYDVQFFDMVNPSKKNLSINRAGIIILDDSGASQSSVEKSILSLTQNPELLGSRFVLSTSVNSPVVNQLAVCSGFKDILPYDLDDRDWLERFVFSTSRKAIKMSTPFPQVTSNAITSISVPARLTQINETHLQLESKAMPKVGNSLYLSGPLANALGLEKISLTVEERSSKNLVFRFSQAIVASWKIPDGAKAEARTLLNKLRQTSMGRRKKVFAVFKTPELRRRLVDDLDSLRFEVNVALHKKGIISEPSFFCPDIVFIEDEFCVRGLFDEMLSRLDEATSVFVVGTKAKTDDVLSLRGSFAHRIYCIPNLPIDLSQKILMEWLADRSKDDDNKIFIKETHQLSMLELSFPARITKVHPSAVEISSSIAMSNFGMCRIDTPLIKRVLARQVYAKITNVFENLEPLDQNFSHVAECYLSDVGSREKSLLAKAISDFITFEIDASADEAEKIVPIKTMNEALIISKMQKKLLSRRLFKVNILPAVKFALKSTALVAIAIFALWLFATVMEPYWPKSGAEYTESLRKFAPDKFKEAEERARQQEETQSQEVH
jgi:hypothetical protein